MGMALQPLGLGEADLGLRGAGSREPTACFLMLVSSTYHGITVLWGRGTVEGDFLWAVPPSFPSEWPLAPGSGRSCWAGALIPVGLHLPGEGALEDGAVHPVLTLLLLGTSRSSFASSDLLCNSCAFGG